MQLYLIYNGTSLVTKGTKFAMLLFRSDGIILYFYNYIICRHQNKSILVPETWLMLSFFNGVFLNSQENVDKIGDTTRIAISFL